MALVVQAPEPRLGARILSIAEVCDAVAALLNAVTLSRPSVAIREYLPRFDLADLGDRIKLSVTPGESFIATRSARGVWQRDIAVRVTAIAALGADPYEEEIDALMAFVEEIRYAIEAAALPDSETWKGQPSRVPLVAVSIEADPIIDAAMLEQMRQFTSSLTVTYRVID